MADQYTMENATAIVLLCSTLLFTVINSIAVDTIGGDQTIRDGDTITSAGGEFQLGFFSPGSSTNRYFGIWYKKIANGTVLWVANRDTPIKNNSGVVRLNDKGITVQIGDVVIWSSNVSKTMKNPVAQLLDSGNLVLRDDIDDDDGEKNNANEFIWQSFDHPGDTLIAGMKAGIDLVTGVDRYFTSWKSVDDPSTGSFTGQIDPHGFPQFFRLKDSAKWARTGPWNGGQFSGSPKLKPNGIYTENFVFNDKEIYYVFNSINSTSSYVRMTITPNGDTKHLIWNDENQIWKVYFTEMVGDCDIYGICGANDICNINSSPICECLKGFKPKFPEKWEAIDWSSGCVRKTTLDCGTKVGFMKYSGVKLPDTRYAKYDMKISFEECGRLCLKNCNCTAYANADIRNGGSGCILWFNDLYDIKGSAADGQDIYVKMPASELVDSQKIRAEQRMWIIASSLVVAAVLALISVFVLRKGKRKKENLKLSLESVALKKIESEDWELPLFSFKQIAKATDNFSQNNKLGEGGFGPVFKGMLSNGKEIAVKRLSKNSDQGVDEFINEVSCIAKLQHRNLVTLLGCCTEKGERILIYEFMANNSLDTFIFDQSRPRIDWLKRYNIINGIARGLLYLHQDSKLRIIHRDLKASNILLDHEMNPKISDFGMARRFEGSQTEANTVRIVGTYGYMPPEYAIDGLFSVKSDVYSFGVLLVEIVSGKKNRLFSHPDHSLNLLGHAWKCYNEDKLSGIIDEVILEPSNQMQILRVIQIGLICVQEDPTDRPVMSEVVLMLSSNMKLPHPKKPGFFMERVLPDTQHLLSNRNFSSGNNLTVTAILPRD